METGRALSVASDAGRGATLRSGSTKTSVGNYPDQRSKGERKDLKRRAGGRSEGGKYA